MRHRLLSRSIVGLLALLVAVSSVAAADDPTPTPDPSATPASSEPAETPEATEPEETEPEATEPEETEPEANEPDEQKANEPAEHEADEDGAAPSADKLARIVEKLAAAGIVTTPEALAALAAQVGLGGAVRTLAFANASGKTPAEILAMRADGMGWGQIRKELGLSIGPGIGWLMGNGHGKGDGHGKGNGRGPDGNGPPGQNKDKHQAKAGTAGDD